MEFGEGSDFFENFEFLEQKYFPYEIPAENYGVLRK